MEENISERGCILPIILIRSTNWWDWANLASSAGESDRSYVISRQCRQTRQCGRGILARGHLAATVAHKTHYASLSLAIFAFGLIDDAEMLETSPKSAPPRLS